MYSSEDFERFFIRYKGEAYPRGESIQTFCHRNNVPVDGRPSAVEEEKPTEAVALSKETVVKDVRILLDLRISNRLHLLQGNFYATGISSSASRRRAQGIRTMKTVRHRIRM